MPPAPTRWAAFPNGAGRSGMAATVMMCGVSGAATMACSVSFASRICGSADIYAKSGKGPECSINFVTCHDGFTLNDLVSYRDKAQ